MSEKHKRRWGKITKLSLVATGLWFAGCLVVALAFDAKIWHLTLNEAGDFWAGIAAPAAFYWLILGFFQQKEELALQIEEMRTLIAESNTQTSLLREEAGRALHASELSFISEEFNTALRNLIDQIRVHLPPWYTRQAKSGASHHGDRLYDPNVFATHRGLKNPSETMHYISTVIRSIPRGNEHIWLSFEQQDPEKFEHLRQAFMAFQKRLSDLQREASSPGKERLQNLKDAADLQVLKRAAYEVLKMEEADS